MTDEYYMKLALQEARVAAEEGETGLYEHLQANHADLLDRIENGFWDAEDVAAMDEALKSFRR